MSSSPALRARVTAVGGARRVTSVGTVAVGLVSWAAMRSVLLTVGFVLTVTVAATGRSSAGRGLARARRLLTDRALPAVERWSSVEAAVILPVAGVWGLNQFLLERGLPVGVQVAVLAVEGTVLALGSSVIASSDRRARVVERSTNRALWSLHLALAFAAAPFFGTVTALLAQTGLVAFTPASGTATAGTTSDFFVWHLMDAIPVVDVTGTLRWDEPLTYTDTRVGVLVLAFQVTVVLPVAATLRTWWNQRDADAGAGSSPAAD